MECKAALHEMEKMGRKQKTTTKEPMKKQFEVSVTAETFSKLRHLPEFMNVISYPETLLEHMNPREIGILKISDNTELKCHMSNEIWNIKHTLRNGLRELSDKIKGKDKSALETLDSLCSFLDNA